MVSLLQKICSLAGRGKTPYDRVDYFPSVRDYEFCYWAVWRRIESEEKKG